MQLESNVYLDRSGTLAAGMFYQFHETTLDDRAHGPPVEGTVLSSRSPTQDALERRGERYLAVRVTHVERVEHHRCPESPGHVTERAYAKVRYRIDGRGPLADFVRDTQEVSITGLLRGAFAAKLRESGLTGCRLEKAEPKQSADSANLELHVLNFLGKNCRRRASLRNAPNACPFCGYEPLICPACGEEAQPCPRCWKTTMIRRRFHNGPEDKTLIIDEPETFLPLILDGDRWDGSDFIYPYFITKRTLDWLLSTHAAPFVAKPVLICTDGMADEQKAWLERAQRPVGGSP